MTLSRRTVLSSLAVVPAGLILSACSDSGQESTAANAAPASAASAAPQPSGTLDMAEVLKPGALPDKAKGSDDAKVTVVEYASMTCSHCANFAVNTYPEVEKKYVDTGKVRFILREFPFDPRAEAGFMLARCAGDNYFPMVDVLFKQQQNWAAAENVKDAMFQLAKLAGFTQESFNACLTDQNLLEQVRAVQKRGAEEFKIDSTPTFIINGKVYKGALSIDEISAVIDPLL
ncbi:DsbA family protein [Aquamicrobium terrae]